MSKRIITTILLLAVVLMSIPHNAVVSIANAAKGRTLDDIIVYTEAVSGDDSSSENAEPIAEYLAVTLQLNESYDIGETRPQNKEELLEHRQKLRAHYTEINQALLEYFDLENYDSVTCSEYGPFIEYRYDNEDDFYGHDKDILDEKITDDLNVVYVCKNIIYEDSTTDSADIGAISTEYEYLLPQAFADVGIPETNEYDGTGIKIGFLESYLPENVSHLTGVTYEFRETKTSNNSHQHSFGTSYIAAGNYGIAKGASLYFSNIRNPINHQNNEIDAYEWLIEKNVDIINRSNSYKTGAYDALSAYTDYIVSSTFVTVVCAVGSQKGDGNMKMGSPSTAINAICVAATNSDKEIDSGNTMQLISNASEYLLKPTVAAPGGVFICERTPSDYIAYGSSFAAPIVTGIIALLMDEFGYTSYPERYMAVIANSCTFVSGQAEYVDSDAGWGLVNYTNARNIMSNSVNYDLINYEGSPAGTIVFTKEVTVPEHYRLKAVTTVLFNQNTHSYGEGENGNPNEFPYEPWFTRVKVAIEDVESSIMYYGESESNFGYRAFSFYGIEGTQKTYKIHVIADSEVFGPEFCSLSYVLEPIQGHVHSYNYTYQSGTGYHTAQCNCGYAFTEGHTWSDYSTNNVRFCIKCGDFE